MNNIIIETKKIRHILSLSGGKDSTALALYMKDRIPEMEYVFCDTGEELPETYDYLDKLEAHLGKIVRLNPDRPFKYYLEIYGNMLPDPRTRWCTRMLKIRPFERFVGDDPVILYTGIRADETERKGYISTKSNITSCFPFIEDGIRRDDVFKILEDSGLGLPDYYKWRSRSGCYFCFFQQKREWVGLLENHADLYWKASGFEKIDLHNGTKFTWNDNESLKELANPCRIEQIKRQYMDRLDNGCTYQKNMTLMKQFIDEDEYNSACLICRL